MKRTTADDAIRLTPIPHAREASFHPPRWLASVGSAHALTVESAGARVHAVPGRWTVTYVLEGPDALVIGDIGSIGDLAAIDQVVCRAEKPVKAILPTHTHFDHFLGVEAATHRYACGLVTGPVSRELLLGRTPLEPPQPSRLLRYFVPDWILSGMAVPTADDLPVMWRMNHAGAWPRLEQPERVELSVIVDGAELPFVPGWRVLMGRGHSPEDISLYHEESGILICGDNVTNFRGGEWNGIVTEQEAYDQMVLRLRELTVRALLPGHGPLIAGEDVLPTITDVAEMPLMLRPLIARPG